MTACTERHPAAPHSGLAGEGQKGMPSWHRMTACTERHPAAAGSGPAGGGRHGLNDLAMRKVGTA